MDDAQVRQNLRSIRVDQFLCGMNRMTGHGTSTRGWIIRPKHVVIYTEKGSLAVDIEDDEKKVKRVTGQCVYVPAGTRRRGIVTYAEGVAELRYMHLMYHYMGNSDFLGNFLIESRLSEAQTRRCKAIHGQGLVLRESMTSDIMLAGKTACLAMELLDVLLDNARIKTNFRESKAAMERLDKVFRRIASNLDQDIAVSTLAETACVSEATLHRLFKRATGLSPHHYVRRARLYQAANQLLESERSIGEIAACYGYADAFSFSKSFKKQFGESPSTFRTLSTI